MDGDLAPIFFVLLVVMTAVQPQISKGPTNSLKGTGDRITLQCFTNNRDCTLLDWQKVEGRQSPKIVYRNGVGMIKNELFPTERYNVTEGLGCNLTITQLKVNDSGRYVCVLTMPGGTENTKSSVLVVVDATEKCVANLTNTNLVKGDVYSASCAIKMPPKTLEPTDVMLKMDNHTGTVDTADPNMDIRATLAEKVIQDGKVKHVCRASFEPISKDGYDSTPASLDVCTFNQSWKIEFYPVESVTVFPEPYCNGSTVNCTAFGKPPPTYLWKNSKDEVVQRDSILKINANAGDSYTCIATNTFKGTNTSNQTTIKVEASAKCDDSSGGGSNFAIILGGISAFTIFGFACGLVVYFCWKNNECPLYGSLRSIKCREDEKGRESGVPLTSSAKPINDGPEKPPRSINDHQ